MFTRSVRGGCSFPASRGESIKYETNWELQPTVGFQICGYKKASQQTICEYLGFDLLRDNWCAAFILSFSFFFTN